MKRQNLITENQAIAIVGQRAIDDVLSCNCEPTGRLMPNGFEKLIEFRSSIDCEDAGKDDCVVTAYYYQDSDDIDDLEDGDLSNLDWTVEGYEIV